MRRGGATEASAGRSSHRFIEQILEASRRGSTLTRQLISFTRKRSTHPEPIDLDEVVAETEGLLSSLLRDDICVKMSLDSGACVLADAGELEQILINLTKNAQDAMAHGGPIKVRTNLVEVDEGMGARMALRPGSYARLDVRDWGVGMDLETKARIFEPFFTTKGVGQGSGLGLSTTFGIVRRLGGDIEVETARGAGTTIRIYLPTTGRGEEAEDESEIEQAAGLILVVEDDRIVRLAVRATLEELGYDVAAASGAKDAVQLLEEGPERFDAVLLDVMMPGQCGDELARQWRSAYPGLRIIYMSAHDKIWLVEQGRLEEEDLLIEKPFGVEELAEIL